LRVESLIKGQQSFVSEKAFIASDDCINKFQLAIWQHRFYWSSKWICTNLHMLSALSNVLKMTVEQNDAAYECRPTFNAVYLIAAIDWKVSK